MKFPKKETMVKYIELNKRTQGGLCAPGCRRCDRIRIYRKELLRRTK